MQIMMAVDAEQHQELEATIKELEQENKSVLHVNLLINHIVQSFFYHARIFF